MNRRLLREAFVLGIPLVLSTSMAGAVDAVRSNFGTLPNGRAVEAVLLTNSHAVTVKIITLGASIQSLQVPDRDGREADIVLGYSSLAGYAAKPEYFGATVGRFANRLANAGFTLDGTRYQLTANNGANALHGGITGFDKVVWQIEEVKSGPTASVALTYVSADGDQGYPGRLSVKAIYTLNEQNEVSVHYSARTDRATIVNISNHTYFNLAGEGSSFGVLQHILTIPADSYTPVDSGLIPTGEFRPVAGTAFDFRRPKPMGQDLRDARDEQIVFGKGYDHNWVLGRVVVSAPRLVARVEEPITGRVMEVLSDQPGLQFYSGNFLDGSVIGKAQHAYRQGDAFVLEPQKFPDTPNRPEFGSARLAPGETYENRITYRFSIAKR